MSNILSETFNKSWKRCNDPFFSVITPVYNRIKTIKRAIDSVEAQSFRDIEYIIIDDGSTDSSDSIIIPFMSKTNLPVAYIKKENGGVHTARNLGYDYARGKYIICLDSDDELTEHACEHFFNAWNSIPLENREKYWQVKALCVDEKGKISGDRFPENINSHCSREARKHFSGGSGEQLGCRVASVLKHNKFPEPEGVKFVNENVLWLPLERRYLSWGINDIVRVYHTEGLDRLTGKTKKTVQSCVDAFWNTCFELNNSEMYISNKNKYFKTLFRYSLMEQILKKTNNKYAELYKLQKNRDKFLKALCFIPAKIGAQVYMRNRMDN